ncbi:hypothetical protein [Sphingopyxis sp.]|uniref:hypothetical protein n=1 Tax=Sphingopyxis sp. TaxID=1908224 RepID=UPI002DEEEC14|nr:hypothetical protein [Sphingopyxis sp.]
MAASFALIFFSALLLVFEIGVPMLGGQSKAALESIAPQAWLGIAIGILLILTGMYLAGQRKIEAVIRSAIAIFVFQFVLFYMVRPVVRALG